MALKNINKENGEKLALKREGHSLIDKIKWSGYSKDQVYELLAKEMRVENRHAHFSAMQTLRELRKAVDALRIIEKRVPKTQKASVDWFASRPAPKTIKILRYKAPKPTKITLPQPPQKKKKQKKGNVVLPRSAYADTLREVAAANTKMRGGHVSVPIEPLNPKQPSWIYKLFKRQ